MNLIKKLLMMWVLCGLVVPLWGESQTVSVSVAVGETKTGVTSSSTISHNNHDWSQRTAADSNVATVELTSYTSVQQPTVSVAGVGAGFTTYVAGYSDSGSTFTLNISVTNFVTETVNLVLPEQASATKTCQIYGRNGNNDSNAQWKLSSSNESVATVSGGADSYDLTITPTITAVGTGSATITVKNGYVTYIYNVTVSKPTVVGDAVTVYADDVMTIPSDTRWGDSWTVTSSDTGVATVAKTGNAVSVTGIAAGTTTVTVDAPTALYTYTVTVKAWEDIEKTVSLAKGPNSATSYTDTSLDSIASVTGLPATTVEVAQSGSQLTFTAKAAGTETIVVTGLRGEVPTRVTYQIKVVEKTQDVVAFGDGYVTYMGATTNWVDGELVLIYEAAGLAGNFEIPAPFTAKIDVLAVGGGGAGGTVASGMGQGAGGGGAGGYTYKTDVSLDVGVYNVSVGAGGQVLRTGETNVGLTGDRGQASSITDTFGHAYVSAQGGGGGGTAIKQGSDGLTGGSGGGAAWYNRKAGKGAAGIDGQGFAGGKPTTYGNGGAGGGAKKAGGDWNAAGAGLANSITGTSVTYAVGGQGGRGYSMTAAADGEGPGFGGAGGNGGKGANDGLGGAGGDGVVVVRIKEVSTNVKVPLPTEQDILRGRYEWAEGQTYTGLVTEGQTFTAADGRVYNWSDAIAYVDGTPSVTCSLEDETKVGIGYYNISIYLKEGFVWNTEPDNAESYGSKDGVTHRWNIVEDLSEVDATVRVKKSVVNQDGSNATVRVESYSSPAMTSKEGLHVLVIGTRCHSHMLTADTFSKTVNAIASNADVDWFLLGNSNKSTDGVISEDTGDCHFGSVVKGTTDFAMSTNLMAQGQHKSLRYFYQYLNAIFNDATYAVNGSTTYGDGTPFYKGRDYYDYIVIETDGGRVAQYYTSVGSDIERSVAEALKPYYDRNAVIWVVDNGFDYLKDGDPTQFDPTNKSYNKASYFQWTDSEGTYGYVDFASVYGSEDPLHVYGELCHDAFGTPLNYRPTTFFVRNSQETKQFIENMTDEQWHAFLGIFDPALYLAWADDPDNVNDYVGTREWAVKDASTTNVGTTTNYVLKAGHTYDNQMFYDDADQLETFMKKAIQPTPYNFEFRDKIVDPEKGLSIQTVSVQVCTNGTDGVASTDANDWVDLLQWSSETPNTFTYLDTAGKSGIPEAAMAVEMTTNLVSLCLSNLSFQVWSRVDIQVLDDGRFRTNQEASYNNITGQWEKNPNEGPAFVELTNITDGSSTGAEGRADTIVPMKFTTHRVTGTVDNGYIYVNGQGSGEGQSLEVSEGSTVPVVYRGKGGYTITSVTVDGTVWGEGGDAAHQSIDEVMTNICTFAEIASDHEVHVVYERYAGTATSSPVTNVYDGAAHLIDVQLNDDWDSPYETEVRYSLDPEAGADEYMTEEEFLEYCRTNEVANTVGGSGEQGYQIYYKVFAQQPVYDEDPESDWEWVDTEVGGSNYSVITPRTLIVTPDYVGPITVGTEFPTDTGYTVTGFIEGDDESVLDKTGWAVVADTYTTSSPEGRYTTSMVGVDASDVTDENYILVTRPGLLDVVKTSVEIGHVPQVPGLDPEDPLVDTGVDRVIRYYDGTPTNITVNVTNPTDDTDFEILYSVADANGEPTEWLPISETSSMIDVGTNKVWYAVNPVGDATGSYFSVTNYSYVITLPRPITVQAASDSKPYDGTALTNPTADVVPGSGELVAGDTISATSVTGSQTAVGVSANTLNSVTITNGDGKNVTSNYAITLVNGELEVTPAPIVINNVPQSLDPDMPNDYGQTGVEDVEIVYNGTGTNILVNVTRPDASTCTITYSIDKDKPLDEWSETIAFTDVGVYQVWFHVEPEEGSGYVPVTNYGYVIIHPREVVVTAEDKECLVGDPEPTYTAKVEGLIDSEKDLVDELIHYGPDTDNNRPDCPTYTDALGTYEIVVSGEENQGNYHVTYVNGTLTITDKQRVIKLWIVDHADAGSGWVHLAFKPTLNGGTLSAEFLKELEDHDAILVKCAPTEAALESAELKVAKLRGGTGTQHLGRGWVWITVEMPDDATPEGPERLWKIVIDLP